MKYVPRKIKDKYEILGLIGEGAYGVVLKARKKDSNTLVAIKYFKQAPGYHTDADVIERELKILQSLRFKNVVELIEWFRDKKRCCLVFEYVEWNMLQVLQEHPEGLSLDHVRRLSYQLFSAIHWCHKHEIIHRDIKPENLLISENFILKLCDFGFARFCNTKSMADYYTDYVATRWYRSPELLVGSPYGKPVDLWACGCIMAELKTGQALFAGESDIDQLYRIQKCLGSLPAKYMLTMNTNPKFQGLKFPPIHHLDTLEQRFGHLFPSDIMHLFKNTLRLYAADRLTAEKCIEHEAFLYLNQNGFQQQYHQSKMTYGSANASLYEIHHNNEIVNCTIPSVDKHYSKLNDENNETQIQRRFSPLNINSKSIDHLNDISSAVSSSINQQIQYHSSTQLTDRSTTSYRHQPKLIRTQSSDEQLNQFSIFSPRSSNITTDYNDLDDSKNILSQKQYLKNPQSIPSSTRQEALLEQQLSTSSTLNYASNGILLRSKQQEHSTNILQTLSKKMDKKFKRYSLDQYQTVSNKQQQTSEFNINRSSMAFMPSQKTNIYASQTNNNQNVSMSYQQIQDEFNNELQEPRPTPREINQDFFRSRTVDYHSPRDTTPIPQRTFSRQTQYQIVSDLIDQVDNDSTVPTTYKTSRNFEQQLNQKYPWISEQRRSIYGSDSYLISSNGHNSCFNRPFYSPKQNDYIHMNKTTIVSEQEPAHDLNKSTKLSSKQNLASYPKTPMDSNRRQKSSTNSFGVYPSPRMTPSHLANGIISSSYQRQQSIRFLNNKSRHDDN
ncbi:unnamed protein product [Rotaria sp. Silwood1]|nr:unnamed protein product [Rotaria sp. Silwood1]CAF3380977.1 unnamed protein product [Rotaria sp. Silwood1]CAF3408297.1 unnamed protein product [Rotaria sp. Silwood1]CAF4512935.1 unnamed protein product [Rotaria sp. Silwood1]CAF4604188.1 unnamed protein product [Rotaria sp. Silwood1]